MTDFQLDTSGAVWDRDARPLRSAISWPDLIPFCQGAVEAALRELLDNGAADDARRQGLSFADLLRFDRIAPATLARIMADCFQWADRFGPDWPDAASGCDFWSERQAERWESEGFPPLHLYLGDDGLIHHRETNP